MQFRKLLVGVFAFVIFLAGAVQAQTEKPRISVSSGVGVYSKYIVDNGILYHDDPLLQGSVTLTFNRCGGYIDLWGSMDFDGIGNYGEEIDVTAGWIFKKMNIGVSFLDYAKVFSTQEPDFVRLFSEIPLPFFQIPGHQITPFFRYEYYAATREYDLNSGAWMMFGLRHTWELSRHWIIRQEGKIVYDGGVFQSLPGFLGIYNAAVDLSCGSATLTLLSVRQSMIPQSMTDRENKTIVGASVNATIY